jgi:glycosyltransferase involved in cell wall biosynthesis
MFEYHKAMSTKKILIEGWRGINHSYAMVNQYQLLEMKAMDFELQHLDIPFYNEKWNLIDNDSGFEEGDKQKIASIQSADSTQTQDVTYRISFPYRFYPAHSEKLFVFGTSEFQNIDGYIYKDGLQEGISNQSLSVVTPSNWSKIGFLKAGFDESKVAVVPHGVNQKIYKPISLSRRKEFRDALRASEEEFLILSLGAMTYNKGIDILILAFATLKIKYPHIKLVLKDSSNLYGIRLHDVLGNIQKQNSKLVSGDIIKSIISMSDNLTQRQLNGLYGAVDCYVSPYRAEGFNLPPLEAAASGTPILITRGGSTDDYFHESFALHIESALHKESNGTYLEPSLDSLIDQLSILIEGKANSLDNGFAQQFIAQNFTWAVTTNKLVSIF